MARIKIEHIIQKQVVKWFNKSYLDTYKLLGYTMGGTHNFGVRKGAVLKAMGLRSGWPDLFLAKMRGGYGGLFVEVKSPGGKLSKVQKEMHAMLIGQGYCVRTGEGRDECKDIITRYILGKIRREGFTSQQTTGIVNDNNCMDQCNTKPS